MTDNEIIRIAENCCSDKPNCTCCPFDVGTNTVDECMEKLIQHCVDLFNRQKAVSEQKDVEIDILIRKKETLHDESFKLTAEVERLNKALTEQQLKNNMLYETAKEAQSEAIKEFAERLKERATGMLLMGERFSSVDTDDIDNLVKEMCGE